MRDSTCIDLTTYTFLGHLLDKPHDFRVHLLILQLLLLHVIHKMLQGDFQFSLMSILPTPILIIFPPF